LPAVVDDYRQKKHPSVTTSANSIWNLLQGHCRKTMFRPASKSQLTLASARTGHPGPEETEGPPFAHFNFGSKLRLNNANRMDTAHGLNAKCLQFCAK
jgi:hypothetical protein